MVSQGAGERASDVRTARFPTVPWKDSEQLTVMNGLIGQVALLVHGTGHHALAGAALPEEQDRSWSFLPLAAKCPSPLS